MELPDSFKMMKSLEDIRLEFNPMRSPPADLAHRGVDAVIKYCRIRQAPSSAPLPPPSLAADFGSKRLDLACKLHAYCV